MHYILGFSPTINVQSGDILSKGMLFLFIYLFIFLIEKGQNDNLWQARS